MTTLLRRPEVEALTTLSRSTLYREMEAGRFPRPIRLSAHKVAWRRETIERWLDTRPETGEVDRDR